VDDIFEKGKEVACAEDEGEDNGAHGHRSETVLESVPGDEVGRVEESEKEGAAEQKNQTIADKGIAERFRDGLEEINGFGDMGLNGHASAGGAAHFAKLEPATGGAAGVDAEIAKELLTFGAAVQAGVLIMIFAKDGFVGEGRGLVGWRLGELGLMNLARRGGIEGSGCLY